MKNNEFSIELSLWMLGSNKSANEVAKQIGVSPVSVYSWVAGTSSPHKNNYSKLCRYMKAIDDAKNVQKQQLEEKMNDTENTLLPNKDNSAVVFESVTISLSRYHNLLDTMKSLGKEAQELRKEVYDLKEARKVLVFKYLESGIFDVTATYPSDKVRYLYGFYDGLEAVGITEAEASLHLADYLDRKAKADLQKQLEEQKQNEIDAKAIDQAERVDSTDTPLLD